MPENTGIHTHKSVYVAVLVTNSIQFNNFIPEHYIHMKT